MPVRTKANQVRWALRACLLGLILLNASRWASAQLGYFPSAEVTVPIAPGRALCLRVWTTFEVLHTGGTALDGHWAGLWYQRRTGGAFRYVAAHRMPAWPLLVVTLADVLGLSILHARLRTSDKLLS